MKILDRLKSEHAREMKRLAALEKKLDQRLADMRAEIAAQQALVAKRAKMVEEEEGESRP